MANDGNSEALLMLPSKLVLAGSFQVWPSLASAGLRLMMFMAWAISLTGLWVYWLCWLDSRGKQRNRFFCC